MGLQHSPIHKCHKLRTPNAEALNAVRDAGRACAEGAVQDLVRRLQAIIVWGIARPQCICRHENIRLCHPAPSTPYLLLAA